ncbi:MAG: DnaJ domain-containing protein [Candidatus Omnitrophica bacterium]|nr:DnaJ domain-containing protein [Candidatus Omnitrophota bacterium]
MINFKQIDEARKLLGLGNIATLEEIKEAYRGLSLKYHPDRCSDKEKKHCEEMIKRINHAKDILLAYCANYRYSFKEKDVKRSAFDSQTYQHLKQFYDGWWADLDL